MPMTCVEADRVMQAAYEATDLLEDALAVNWPRPVETIGHARALRTALAELLELEGDTPCQM